MAPKCVLSKADPKTDGIFNETMGSYFPFEFGVGNLWVSFAAFGVGLDDLKDPSPSKGIKGNEFQL